MLSAVCDDVKFAAAIVMSVRNKRCAVQPEEGLTARARVQYAYAAMRNALQNLGIMNAPELASNLRLCESITRKSSKLNALLHRSIRPYAVPWIAEIRFTLCCCMRHMSYLRCNVYVVLRVMVRTNIICWRLLHCLVTLVQGSWHAAMPAWGSAYGASHTSKLFFCVPEWRKEQHKRAIPCVCWV